MDLQDTTMESQILHPLPRPPKYRLSVTKFLRRVIIARMAECPELASAYHRKLKEAYETEDKLKDPEILRRSEEHLERILDEAERKLTETTYLVGEEFTLADVVFIPLLSRLALLNLEEKYINTRLNVAEYWNVVQERPSYRKFFLEMLCSGIQVAGPTNPLNEPAKVDVYDYLITQE
ncbi:UNVERIFIED_CONTAM: Glutathione S-transferase TCHQD [Sesamum calycinum]|uniref:Glutathione S-transferase TCHQD n=1 Tax=Sesamum calycinum TaxID=2727403 RepID=A0AAW2P959_9LAMI